MFNYGMGSSYNLGGYTMGHGYGGQMQMCYSNTSRSNWSIVMVLFIVLVLLGEVLCW